MTRPDFIIIGAMKCATTTLQVQLAAQPGVFMTTPKEPNYFSDDDVFAKGEAWYASLYAEAPPGALLGEASTHYTKLPTYPETVSRMARAVSAPKLVYMIRNPVDRAISHFIHEWSQGLMGHNPQEAFDRHGELIDYGRYGMQIAPFIETFGKDSVFLTSLEQVKADPQGELSRIAAHIGISAPAVWRDDLEPQNVSAARTRKLPLHGLLVDNPLATVLRRTFVPKALRDRIRQARTYGSRPELSDALRHRLETEFLADRAVLAEFFPDHPALTAAYPFAAG